jgi:Domain of unknown function (DUF4177)
MKWEYKTVKVGKFGNLNPKFDEDEMNMFINNLGQEGWEFVSSYTVSELGTTLYVVLIFKRLLVS